MRDPTNQNQNSGENDCVCEFKGLVPCCKPTYIINGQLFMADRPPKDDKPSIIDMYWTYGEEHTRLECKDVESGIWKTKHYFDLNLHVKTKNYNNGNKINITLEKDSGELWYNDTSIIEVSGDVSNNELVLEKTFKEYASNQSEPKLNGVTFTATATAKILDNITGVIVTTRVTNISIEVKPVEVSITKIYAESFVPLGINGGAKNIEIKFEIKNRSAKDYHFKFFVKDTVLKKSTFSLLREENFTENNCSEDSFVVREYAYRWDGFDGKGKYDSKELASGLEFKIVVHDSNHNESTATKVIRVEPMVKWLDVSIDKEVKKIDVRLRVNFENGRPKGPVKDSLPVKSFDVLKKLAAEGLKKYWNGRVEIGNQYYHVAVVVADEHVDVGDAIENQMSAIQLIFTTTKRYMRSRNPGKTCDNLSFLVKIFIKGKVFYNVGYHYARKDRKNRKNKKPATAATIATAADAAATEGFKFDIAHEIGHEILQMFGGSMYSYKHKNTSTLIQTTKMSTAKLPSSGTVDLMKYYRRKKRDKRDNPDESNNGIYWAVNEDDMLGLIWLINGGVK